MNSSALAALPAESAAAVIPLLSRMSDHNDWRWGVDIGERKLAIVAMNANNDFTWRIRDPGPRAQAPDLAPELLELRYNANELARSLMQRCAPLVVAVESPSGSHRNSRLESAFGVIVEGLAHGIAIEGKGVPPFAKVSSSTWKKKCFGAGNVRPERYHALAKEDWDLRANDNPDVSAALWLAVYAHTLKVTTG